MENVQGNPTIMTNPPVYHEQSKGSSLSMIVVVFIFIGTFLVLILAIGAFFYFFVGSRLKNISNQVNLEKGTTNQISPNPNSQNSQVVADQRNQYYVDITETKNLWNAGRYQEALDRANKALPNAGTNEDKAVTHYWIGLINYKQQNSSVAESELKLALELFPNYAAPYVTLSAIEMDKGNFQKSLEYAQKCVNLDKKYAWCHNNIGLSLMYLGKKEEGIKELEQAVSLAPDSYVFRDNLTRAKQSK